MYSSALAILTLLVTRQVLAASTLYRYPGGLIGLSCPCTQSIGGVVQSVNIATAQSKPVASTAASPGENVPAAAQVLPAAAASVLTSAGVPIPQNLVSINGQVDVRTTGDLRVVIYIGIFINIDITSMTRTSTVTTTLTVDGAASIALLSTSTSSGSSGTAMIAPVGASSSMRFTNSSTSSIISTTSPSSSVFVQPPCTLVAQTVTASVSTLFADAQTLLATLTNPIMTNIAVKTVSVTVQVTVTLTLPATSTETEYINPPLTSTTQSSSTTSQTVGPFSTLTVTDATLTSTSITSTATSTSATIVEVLTYCVLDGFSCGFTGTSEIYYGVIDTVASTTRLVSTLATNGAACTGAAFTSDPAPGTAKTCYLGAPVTMMKRDLHVKEKRQSVASSTNCPASSSTVTVTSTLYPVITLTPTSLVRITDTPRANVTSQLSITAIALTTTDVYENTTTSIQTTATVTTTQTTTVTVTVGPPTDYATASTTLSLTSTSVDISRTTTFSLAPTPSCTGLFDALVTLSSGSTGFLTSSGTSLLYTSDPLQAVRFRYDSTDQSIALFGQVAGSPRFLNYDPTSLGTNGCENVILSATKGAVTQLQCIFVNRQFSCQKSTDLSPEVFSFNANTLQICPLSTTAATLKQGCLDGSDVNANYYAVQISGNGYPTPSYLTQTFNPYGQYGPTTGTTATALIVSLGAANTVRTGGLINLAALGREATNTPYFGIVLRYNDYTGTLNDAGGYVVAVGLNNGGYSATNSINIANSGNEGEVIAESGIWQVGGVQGDATRSLTYSWLNYDGSTEFQPYGIGRAQQSDAYMFLDSSNGAGLTVTLVAVQ